ncbi:von Willebrand factor type A domain-containing protein [Halorubrum xinjiangense]|uniref:von Willebrand factor type A domain-containing protein n=1 Tax=Halorubrum xinjiangense TaxID=261291 RepID=A0A1G7QZM8_9EURY|nr:vWA domain-containing protein [Halorubrum xinjiangense]SDG03976.1 von Willebrand factor type A domain-containing protein [Halorubrum xinjiangense]
MTTTNTDRANRTIPLSRRSVLRTTGAAGALAVAGAGLPFFTRVAAADEQLIETCGGDVDVVVALDYSGSIRSAGTWGDIQSGVDSFLAVVPEDVQLGLVTFGDAPSAFEYGPGNLLDFATASNVSAIRAGIPASVPQQENATHMPGALDFSNAILEQEGRGGTEIIILITDGGPNYESGVVGDGAAPPDDDTTFPYGTFAYTGGSTGSENGTAGEQGEIDETTSIATAIKDAGRRVIAVGIGENVAGFDDYLRDEIASSADDFVSVQDASNLGSELDAVISEVCEECVDCSAAGQLAKYEFACVETDPDTGECLAYDFVPEGAAADTVAYTPGSFVSKPGEPFEPMAASFDTAYCDLYALVKSGRELEVQSFEGIDGSLTVETANDEKFAISFVAFYCTEDAAIEALARFPSRGSRSSPRGNRSPPRGRR